MRLQLINHTSLSYSEPLVADFGYQSQEEAPDSQEIRLENILPGHPG